MSGTPGMSGMSGAPETPGLIRLLRQDPEFRQFFYDDHVKQLKEHIRTLEKRVSQLESYNKSYEREVAHLTEIIYDLQESPGESTLEEQRCGV